MQRFDHPSQPANPYPAPGSRITGFEYRSALVLLRLKDAPKLRTGEDADYILQRPYDVAWRDGDGNWQAISVPAGLITDLTSVPRLLRWIVGRVGPWLEAAIVHDYLYIAWQDVPGKAAVEADRRFADDLMLAAMREADVLPWMARAIHWGVRTFGGGAYRRRNADRYVNLGDPEVTSQLALVLPR